MGLLRLFQLLAALAVGCDGFNINYDYSDQALADFIARTVRKLPLYRPKACQLKKFQSIEKKPSVHLIYGNVIGRNGL